MMKRLINVYRRFNMLADQVTRMQESLGRIESRQTELSMSIAEAEFRVFSQWGEDGILQYLIGKVDIDRKIFVEFGVENYVESNTRFLLINNHWSGLVFDGETKNIDYILRDPIYWATNIRAVNAFITRDNINQLLEENGITGDIGILSVDIDGNDYWVWDEIYAISPRIVVCEYNSQFGPNAEITVPYDPAFVRGDAHHSKIYYGASISALTTLANRKGYSLIAGNSAGNNIFFVRNDLVGSLIVMAPREIYRQAQFREYHDEEGRLTFDNFDTRLEKIGQLPVFDLKKNKLVKLHELKSTGEL
jgi:hypothetical protein